MISQITDLISSDPARARNTIYELARAKVREMASKQDPPMSVLETRRLVLVLESTIERVEALSSDQNEAQLGCSLVRQSKPAKRMVERSLGP